MAAILKKIGELVLGAILGRLAAFIKDWMDRRKREREAKRLAEMSVEPLKKAQTAKEIDDAIDVAMDRF